MTEDGNHVTRDAHKDNTEHPIMSFSFSSSSFAHIHANGGIFGLGHQGIQHREIKLPNKFPNLTYLKEVRGVGG